VRDHEAAGSEEVADGREIERHDLEAGAVERIRLARLRAVGGAIEPLDRRRRGRGRVLRPRRGGERAQIEEQQLDNHCIMSFTGGMHMPGPGWCLVIYSMRARQATAVTRSPVFGC
jgi:hypothetical protein